MISLNHHRTTKLFYQSGRFTFKEKSSLAIWWISTWTNKIMKYRKIPIYMRSKSVQCITKKSLFCIVFCVGGVIYNRAAGHCCLETMPSEVVKWWRVLLIVDSRPFFHQFDGTNTTYSFNLRLLHKTMKKLNYKLDNNARWLFLNFIW